VVEKAGNSQLRVRKGVTLPLLVTLLNAD